MWGRFVKWQYWSPILITLAILVVALLVSHEVYDGRPRWRRELWTALPATIQVTAGAIALAWSLWQFNKSHNQREMHFVDQQKIMREHFSSEQKLTRDNLESQQQLTREHFDRDAQRTAFAEILNRLASDDVSTRASAALRLGAFSTTLRVGGEPGNFDEPLPEHSFSEYPYFDAASQQLCTALNIENNHDVRNAIADAVQIQVRSFDRTSPDDPIRHPFLYWMIGRLAKANRLATASFISTVAEFAAIRSILTSETSNAPQVASEDIDLIASLAPFYRSPGVKSGRRSVAHVNRAIIESLLAVGTGTPNDTGLLGGEFLRSWHVFSAAHSKSAQTVIETRLTAVIMNLQDAADRLIILRDILADAICRLDGKEGQNKPRSTGFGQHALFGTFLAGAYLQHANLPAFNLSGTFFQGADMAGAHLDGALLVRANMQYADLSNATLVGTGLYEANLKHAMLSGAVATEAKLPLAGIADLVMADATFRNSNMSYLQFVGVDLSKADLQGANLRSSSLRLAKFDRTLMHGVQFDFPEDQETAIFPTGLLDSNRVILDASDDFPATTESDRRTEELRRHLADDALLNELIAKDIENSKKGEETL